MMLRMDYDAAGRLKSKFEVPPWSAHPGLPARVASHNDDNQITSFNGQAITHDLDGNLLSAPAPDSTGPLASYTWNARNQLTSAPGNMTYAYDSEGHRTSYTLSGSQTTLVVDPHGPMSRVLWRVRPDGTRTFYIYGPVLLYEIEESASSGNPANAARFYHYDHLGSTIALTDDVGSVTGRANYSAYGVTTHADGNIGTPFLWQGAFGVQTDPNGLHHMRARYYHAVLGRFMSEDPIGLAGGSNLYVYCHGSPLLSTDPDGEWAWVAAGALIGGALDGGLTLYLQHRAGNGIDWRAVGGATARGALAGAVSSLAGPAAGSLVRAGGGLATGVTARAASVGISAAGSAAGQVLNNAITGQELSSGTGVAAAFGAGGQVLSNTIPVRGVASLAQARHFAPQSAGSMVATSNAQRLTTSYVVSNAVSAGSNLMPPPASQMRDGVQIPATGSYTHGSGKRF